jgi:tight adherence protein B
MQPIVMIVILAAATIGLLVYGVSIAAGRRKAILAERLETYAGIEEEAAPAAEAELQKLSPVPRILRVLLGRGYMQKVEDNLARADIPMRASEYILLRLVLAGVGFLCGMYGLGYLHSGVILAIVGFVAPAVFVRIHQNRRRTKFVTQLADALMLLTNSLRSGYGFLKGLELIAKEMGDPIAKELNRLLREINLGATIDQAMLNLGRRINSQDLDIVISAYLIQKDVGGNLTEIMEKVAETIRERLRIQGDIRVLTAQGKLSGLIVGLLPLFLFIFFWLRAPDYYNPLFGPPMGHIVGGLDLPVGVLLLLAAFCWQILGAYFIYKITNIKV